MIHTRRIGALSALALTLVLSACSTPEDLAAPTLEVQFGTADDDRGIDVAFVSTGRIYSLSEEFGFEYMEYEDGTSEVSEEHEKLLLKRQDGNGNVTWTTEVMSYSCDYNSDEFYWYGCATYSPRSVEADSKGYAYVLYTSKRYSENYHYNFINYSLERYDASGNYVNYVDLGGTGAPAEEETTGLDAVRFVVDANGNVYSARSILNFSYEPGDGAYANVVSKHTPTGTLLWQRISTVGVPTDITVSSSGSVYVVGTRGVARYSNSGGLTWTKSGNFEEVVVSGSNLYTRYRKDIRKYDGNGKQLWLKLQTGLNTIVFQDMDGDGSGNVYLTGKYQASTGNMNAMVRKLNSSGSVLWTKTYGTPYYDDARGIATITGSEIYTTGETQGSLAHANRGGRDGYLRKFSSSGGTVWTR